MMMMAMLWRVIMHVTFRNEVIGMSKAFRTELSGYIDMLKQFGPTLGRDWVDTVKGSRYPNMKELRFNVDGGVWRVLFIFDPNRTAVLLVAGNKRGKNEGRFYADLIAEAEARYEQHLATL